MCQDTKESETTVSKYYIQFIITKDYYACTSSSYNTNWVKAQRQPYNFKICQDAKSKRQL